ncbi:hypothetical protein HDZ31DRAFT_27977 [Schizophyllum fasciatum]
MDRPTEGFVHKLPPEVLCQIFLMCGDWDNTHIYPRDRFMHSYGGRAARFCFSRMAATISHVCSRWLHVSRANPAFWTLVDLKVLEPHDVMVMRLCLQYSAGRPLVLRLEEFSASNNPISVCRQLMRIVSETPGRWQELTILMRDAVDALDSVLTLTNGLFTSLERVRLDLRVRGYDEWSIRLDSRFWQLLYTSPNLREVEWWGDPYDDLSASSAPLQQLTQVVVKGIQPKHFIDLLRSCPQLEAIQACVVRALRDLRIPDIDIFPSSTRSITLKKLRVLMLHGLEDYSRLFPILIVPALSRLELRQSGVQAAAIESMLLRSDAALRMFTIHCPCTGWLDDIQGLLQSSAMQSLRIFRYDPCVGVWRQSDYETLDIASFVPAHVKVFTSEYAVSEAAYRKLAPVS